MNYEGFKQYVADHIKEFLPQDYSVHEISITKQRKNNDVVWDALSIKGDSILYLSFIWNHTIRPIQMEPGWMTFYRK